MLNSLISQPTTWIEEDVYALYQELSISKPWHIDIESIAYACNVRAIQYEPTTSFAAVVDRQVFLNIDSRLSWPEQRVKIAHELAHGLISEGSQIDGMPDLFIQLQESQVKSFAGYALIPSFMVADLDLPEYPEQVIGLFVETFEVPWEFAAWRYDQIARRMFTNLMDGRKVEHWDPRIAQKFGFYIQKDRKAKNLIHIFHARKGYITSKFIS